jgi:hypothetical protein
MAWHSISAVEILLTAMEKDGFSIVLRGVDTRGIDAKSIPTRSRSNILEPAKRTRFT